MKRLEYPVIISPLSEDDGGGFLATVPDLPGCMSDGETPEEATSTCRMRSPPGWRVRGTSAATCRLPPRSLRSRKPTYSAGTKFSATPLMQ